MRESRSGRPRALTRPDGSTGAATVTPTIPFQSISVVHGQDCSQQDFEKVAKISIAPALRYDPPVAADGKRAALLDLTFTPTGAPGSVTLQTTRTPPCSPNAKGRCAPST